MLFSIATFPMCNITHELINFFWAEIQLFQLWLKLNVDPSMCVISVYEISGCKPYVL